jgi:hypothetical protein
MYSQPNWTIEIFEIAGKREWSRHVASDAGSMLAIQKAMAMRSPLHADNIRQAARLARISANAALPARVASDIVSKNSDCRTALLLPAA